jgi:N-acetylneuraminate synthase
MLVEDANLITINALKKKYDCKVGYSGHEDGVAVSLAAASLGISSLERHITLSRSMYGSDQSASLEPRGMRELVATINIMIKAYGEERLGHITKEEEKIAKKLRAHLKISN